VLSQSKFVIAGVLMKPRFAGKDTGRSFSMFERNRLSTLKV
jgi:hypothetical protein